MWATGCGGDREVVAEPRGGLSSARLGLELRVEGTNLRVRGRVTEWEYPWIEEVPRVIEVAEARSNSEAEARRRSEADTAEAQLAELEARHRQACQL